MTIPRSHRPGPWYGHWRPTSKRWQKKNLVCETAIWPLALKKPGLWDWGMVTGGPGEKPERRHPSSIKTSRYWWRTDARVKIVTFRTAANTMAQNGRGRIQLFNIWCRRQEKKSWFRLLPFRAIVFVAIRKATILRTASVVHLHFFDLGCQSPYHGPGLWDRGMDIDVPV